MARKRTTSASPAASSGKAAKKESAVQAVQDPAGEAVNGVAPKQMPGPKSARRTKATKPPKSTKLSALDAAAKVLEEAGTPMTCGEMIAAMAAKGYWTSPAGKTPGGTLYAGFLRELKVKGAQARFTKTERGKFGRSPSA